MPSIGGGAGGRQVLAFKRMALTPFKINIARTSRHPTVVAAFNKAEISKKWEATAWAKKLATKAARAQMSDFDRFQVMVAKKARAAVVRKAIWKKK